MLRAISDFFRSQIESDRAHGPDEHGLRLATAALLFEILRADTEDHPRERQAIEQALKSRFELSEDEAAELSRLADQEAAEAISLYQFTGLINDNFTPEQKTQVVEMLWRVAYADGHLDPYEEALVRKIADLIHVPHREFIQAKHRVLEQMT